MGCHQPLFLWFMLLGLVPIILHLLMRFRVRRIRWGATYLLTRALRRLDEENKWWYYLLLASRALLGLALGYAFARPFLPHRAGGTMASEDAHHVLLFDDTYSMDYTVEGRSNRERAVELLAQLAARWPKGEVYSLYTVADGLRPVVERQRFENAERLRETLAAMPLRDGTADLGEALDMIGQQYAADRLAVVLVADAQAANWPGETEREIRAGEQTPIWLQPDAVAGPNLTVTAVAVPGQVVALGDSLQVLVRVRCSRNAAAPQPIVVELDVPGQSRQRRNDTVLPGQIRELAFEVRIDQPGNHALTAALRSHDGLAWDDRMTASVMVREQLRVGVFAAPEARAFDRLHDYLRQTMPRQGTEDAGVLRFHAGDWNAMAEYDVVILDNLPGLPAAQLETLANFVRHGGGLIVSCGPGLVPTAPGHDHPLWPVSFAGQPATMPVDGAIFWMPQHSSLAAPSLAALRAQDADGMASAKIFGYWPVIPRSSAQVLCLLDNGDPWLVGHQFGFGHVLVLTSGLSGIWNNLPVRSGFLHLMHRLVAHATEGGERPMNVDRRDEVLAPFAPDALAVLAGPLGVSGLAPVNLPLGPAVRHGCEVLLHAGKLAHNGLYVIQTIDARGTQERHVSIYDDRVEGDVSRLSPEAEALLAERRGMEIVRGEAALASFLERAGAGPELYVWLMMATLALAFIESCLSWKVGGTARR